MQTKEGVDQGLDSVIEGEDDQGSAKEQPEFPEKYRGKQLTDIIKMHQEAEKLVGRQAQEVGELRRLADDYIKATLDKNKGKDTEEEDPDFFVDPKKAVRKVLESDPDIKALREKTRYLEAKANMEALEKAHPDFGDMVQTPEFQAWVTESKYRQQLFATANKDWDFDAANELFSTWKAMNRGATVDPVKATGVSNKGAVKRGSVPSGSGAIESADQNGGKKVYRRADIIRLMQTDPRRYDALQPEIMRAYQEGRVR